jgi:hypothetical protein
MSLLAVLRPSSHHALEPFGLKQSFDEIELEETLHQIELLPTFEDSPDTALQKLLESAADWRDEAGFSLSLQHLLHFFHAAQLCNLDQERCYQVFLFIITQAERIPLSLYILSAICLKKILYGFWRKDQIQKWHVPFGSEKLPLYFKQTYLTFLRECLVVHKSDEPLRAEIKQMLFSSWSFFLNQAASKGKFVSFLRSQAKAYLSPNLVPLLLLACKEVTGVWERALVERIALRYEQLHNLDRSFSALLDCSMLRIALFIETRSIELLSLGKRYFKKSRYGLERTVFLCGKSFYIASKGKVPLLAGASGTFEKYRTAIQLHLDARMPAIVTAHGVTYTNATATDLAITQNKIRFSTLLQGKKSVVQLLDHTTHLKRLPIGPPVLKIDMFFEYFDCSLFDVAKKYRGNTGMIEIAQAIIFALRELHRMKVIHGDLKSNNIFLRKGELVLADLGFSYHRLGLPNFVMKEGFYGSISFTAPELFGVQNFSGDHYKVEVFALGVVLYEFFHGCYPDWTTFLEDCYKLNVAITPRQQGLFQDKVARSVEGMKQIHFTEKIIADFYRLIVGMLAPDPVLRITLDECAMEIGKIKSALTHR